MDYFYYGGGKPQKDLRNEECPDCLHVYADQDWLEGCQCDNECPSCGEEFYCECEDE